MNLRVYKGGNFPESYYAQCVSYLAVTSWKRWYLAALILNKAFYIYQITTIENDDVPEWCESSVYVGPEELTALKECASNFWENYVVADIPPPVDGSESTSQTISAMYGKSFGNYYGIDHNDIIMYTEGQEATLPKCCIMMEKMGLYCHYLVHYDGKFYDSNLGIIQEYDMSKLLGYLEVKVD